MVVVYLCTWVRCLHFLLLCMCEFACFRMFVFAPLLSLVSFVILHGRQQKAMFHFQKLLERNPTHYQALYKLILLLKRAGKLSDARRRNRVVACHVACMADMAPKAEP